MLLIFINIIKCLKRNNFFTLRENSRFTRGKWSTYKTFPQTRFPHIKFPHQTFPHAQCFLIQNVSSSKYLWHKSFPLQIFPGTKRFLHKMSPLLLQNVFSTKCFLHKMRPATKCLLSEMFLAICLFVRKGI